MNYNMTTPDGKVQKIPSGIRPDVVRFYLAAKVKGVEIKNGKLEWCVFDLDTLYAVFGGKATGYSVEDTKVIVQTAKAYGFPIETDHEGLGV
jgi:hypothetical protein